MPAADRDRVLGPQAHFATVRVLRHEQAAADVLAGQVDEHVGSAAARAARHARSRRARRARSARRPIVRDTPWLNSGDFSSSSKGFARPLSAKTVNRPENAYRRAQGPQNRTGRPSDGLLRRGAGEAAITRPGRFPCSGCASWRHRPHHARLGRLARVARADRIGRAARLPCARCPGRCRRDKARCAGSGRKDLRDCLGFRCLSSDRLGSGCSRSGCLRSGWPDVDRSRSGCSDSGSGCPSCGWSGADRSGSGNSRFGRLDAGRSGSDCSCPGC